MEEELYLHPLLNPVILSRLFQHCSPELLAKCRLVCKTWLDFSLPIWRSTVPIQLTCSTVNNDQDDDDIVTDEDNEVSISSLLQDFLHLVKNDLYELPTISIPHRQFHLKNCDIGSLHLNLTDMGHLKQSDSLWRNMTGLKLTFCTFASVEQFRNLLYRVCPNLQVILLDKCYFPNSLSMEDHDVSVYREPICSDRRSHLKSLSIKMSARDRSFPVSWLELFSHFPCLSSLNLSAGVAFRILEMENVLQAIATIKLQDQRKLPLKELDFGRPIEMLNTESSREMLKLFHLFELPLQSLDIRLEHGMEETVVKDILQRHCKTLVEIRSYKGPARPHWSFPFGVTFEKLRYLFVSDGFCEDLEFLKYTPNLQVLNLIDYENIGKEEYKETKLVYNTWEPELAQVELTKLEELDLDYCISVDDLRNLVKWLPNVKILGMPLNDKQFAIVCEYWRELIRLHVHGQELTDEGVTGIRLRSTVNNQKGSGGAGGGASYFVKKGTRPNISSLKCLQTFDSKSNRLTDVSVFHGFLKLRSLQSLFLNSEIGDEAKRALRQNNVWIS